MKQGLIAKITIVLQHVPLVRNLARQKFIAHFVIGLIKSRNVQFCEVAQHLNDAVKPASNETRIQDFFREVDLDYLVLARLLVSLLPVQGKLRLCLDRTEWDFGQCQVNILLVTVGQGAFHVPLYWELLDNRSGNSNAAQRIAVLQACLAVLGQNERQLASYAGLDVVQRQSGLSAHATRISKRGNVRLRTALYLPALSSLRHNPRQMAFYARLRTRHPSGKPGVIAVMRKLLVLCYSLWKNDQPYDPCYQPGHLAQQEIASAT